MFSSYLHDKRVQTATHSSGHHMVRQEVLRDQLAQRYKRRLDKELVKPSDESPVKKTEPRFRVRGCRTTLERLNQSAVDCGLIDTSASHTPVFLLRPRRKEMELGQPLRFRTKTQTERLAEALARQCGYVPHSPAPSQRTVSAGRGLLSAYHSKTHYKTILSLEMNLHPWQRGPMESELRTRVRLEKLGQTPSMGHPTLLKQPINHQSSLIENIKNVPSTDNLVLTNEQKNRLSLEILRCNEVIPPRSHSPTRSRGGSSPTTYRGDFSSIISLSRKRGKGL